MAIKINNKDLSRRVINGQDVQRVILNGSQIRPTEQKYIDYHVISNRGTGGGGGGGSGVPGGWDIGGGGGGGSVVVGENGVSNGWDTAGGSQGRAELQYVGIPSLINAYKVEIIYSFYWEVAHQPAQFEPFEADLYSGTYLNYQASIYSLGGSSGNRYGPMFYLDPYPKGGNSFEATTGNYIITNIIDFENESATRGMKGPGIDDLFDAASGVSYNTIKSSDSFWIYLNDGVSLSRIDFIVYNTPQS